VGGQQASTATSTIPRKVPTRGLHHALDIRASFNRPIEFPADFFYHVLVALNQRDFSISIDLLIAPMVCFRWTVGFLLAGATERF
jgi:hypothetical protein